jgi:molecular chaperone DnaK
MSLMEDFERVKINTHDRSTKKIINYLDLEDKQDKINDEFYKFSKTGYSVTFGEVEEAFQPIKQGIETVLNRVQSYLKQQDLKIDKLFMVGGFCQFILVQRAIMDALKIDKNDPRIDRSFNITNSAYAISYGACLIANGLVNPIEKYIHTLGIILETFDSHFEPIKLEITLIEGGSNLEELAQPKFYSEPIIAFNHKISITLWLQLLSKGKKHQQPLPDMIELPYCSSDAKYRIGMKVDRSQIAYLVLEELKTGKQLEYQLGNVVSEMFPGHVLIDRIMLE